MLLRAWIAFVLCISFSIAVSSAATQAKVSKKAPDKTANPSVRQWTRSMSLRDKVAQLIIVPIYGELANTRSAAFRSAVSKPSVNCLNTGCKNARPLSGRP